MQWADVLARLQSLPTTFRRPPGTYTFLENAETAAVTRYTAADDAQSAQTTLLGAAGRWVDVFGLLLGIPRLPAEADSAYVTRIVVTTTAGKGPGVAIELFLLLSLGVQATVTDSPTATGYVVNIPGGTALAPVLAAIAYVRPAGVPFVVNQVAGGPYMGTVDFLGRGRATGSYLTAPMTTASPTGSATNSAQATLPTTFLTDPTLNPSL